MEYLEVNLADLMQQYLRDEKTSAARSLLRRDCVLGRDMGLAWLLRHHDEGDVTDSETRKRDSFDYLLAAYGLLETASIIRFVPETVPSVFREEALAHLSHPAVTEYYETKYPLLLPRLYRRRLDGHASASQPGAGEAMHLLFSRFLGLVNRLDADDEVETFLWFVDTGSIGSADLGSTKRLLRNPARTMQALLKAPEKRTAAEASISGAQKFLAFCGELDALLEEAAPYPVFQAAMWQFYAYWFLLIGKGLEKALLGILHTLGRWAPLQEAPEADLGRSRQENLASEFWRSVELETQAEVVQGRYSDLQTRLDEDGGRIDAQEVRAYVSAAEGAVARLLSGRYGQGLPPR